MRVEQEPIEAGESDLLAQFANRFNFLLNFHVHRSMEGYVLELTLGLLDLEKDTQDF